jgi:peroxiredoxin
MGSTRWLQLMTASLIITSTIQGASGQATSTKSELIPITQRVNAPDFTVVDVQGNTFTMASQKGQVVLLDFWAIACGGCKLELPWYVDFDKQYRSKGLSLIGLDMYGEAPEAVKSFALAHQMRYPLAIGTDDVGALYHLGAMPLTVLIDRKGRIAVSHTGVVDPKLFEADIKALLAE